METRWKLALLQTIGGLFGWVWILASIASIYFLVAALAFHGRASFFFWALGTMFIAKWLSRRSYDHQRRVAYEAQLVSRGLSPEEGPSSLSTTSSEVDLVEAQELANKYGAVLERSKSVIAAEGLLPAPKGQIKAALIALARYAKTSGASPESLEPLRIGYASLADFVSNEDAKAATSFDNLLEAGVQPDVDNASFLEIARNMADLDTLDVQRRSANEFARLTAEFDDLIRP